jgi:hypothetical protein
VNGFNGFIGLLDTSHHLLGCALDVQPLFELIKIDHFYKASKTRAISSKYHALKKVLVVA